MKPPKIELAEVSADELAAMNEALPGVDPPVVEEKPEPEPEPEPLPEEPEPEDDEPAGPPAIIDDLAEEAAELEAELDAAEDPRQPGPPPPAGPLINYQLGMLYDDLLVEQVAASETYDTAGKIVKADAYKEANRPLEGIVRLVGAGHRLQRPWYDKEGELHWLRPLWVQEGWRVHFGAHAAQDVTINGEDLLVIKEDAVLAYWRPVGKPAEEAAPPPVEESEPPDEEGCLPPASPNPIEQ